MPDGYTQVPRRKRSATDRLKQRGFTRFTITKADLDIDRLARELERASSQLPPDIECAEGTRNRVFFEFLLVPWVRAVIPMKPAGLHPALGEYTTFLQTSALNPETGGKERVFAAMPDWLRTSTALHALIMHDFDQIAPWWTAARLPILVGCHLLEMRAQYGRAGISTPCCLHRDGQPYTFAHLVRRENAEGGENWIAPAYYANKTVDQVPAEHVLARFTLEKPFESYVVEDVSVSHYVSPVRPAPGQDVGSRVVLLVDFTAYVPDLV
jgi:hypothetical protein